MENLTTAPVKASISSAYQVPLAALLAFSVLYVFFFAPASVTLDGYSHIYEAKVLSRMLAGHSDVHRYFYYNSPLLPNWLCALFLAALSSIIPGELALKILITLTALLLLSSLYYCIDARRYSRQQRAQVLIVLLPFALNAYLTLGFYGFLISSSICIFVLGLLLRHGLAMRLRLQLVTAGLLIGAYFAHPLPVALSLLFPCAQFIGELLTERRDDSRRPELKHLVLSLWPWVLPACAVLWFSLRLANTNHPHSYSLVGIVKGRITGLARDAVLSISPTPSCGTLFIALLALLLASALLHRRQPFVQDRLRFATLTVLMLSTIILYFCAPTAVGDGLGIAYRILLFFAFFLVLLALGSGVVDEKLLTLCSAVAALLVIGFAAEYIHVSREMAPALAELRTATERIPKRSRILLMAYRLTPSCKRWPLLDRSRPEDHWALSSALRNELIVLNDYEALTSHFPIKYSTWRPAGSIDDPIPQEQTAAWLAVLHDDHDADFVVSWGVPSGDSNCTAVPVSPPFEETLRADYDLVSVKQDNSRVQLWRKRG